MSLKQFEILAKLGDGSYSSVYKVKRLEDSELYALKKVKIQNLSDREKENALNEVRILASVKNPFVASYKEAFFDEASNSLCIVMEFADDGDVFQRICESQNNKQFMKEKHIWKIVIQVVRGLKALHELQILHRDMKSANIFLYKDQTAKLGDLNVSKVAKKGLLYTQTGTPYYASPEVWKDQPYDLKSDIWSLGCVTYEMCALVPPFRADDMNGLFKRVLKGQYPPIPSHYSMDMRMLIKTLLQVQPATRPNTEQILTLPYVIKRIKKYFPGKEAYLIPGFVDETIDSAMAQTDSELLRTIKLSKNVFKLSLPQPSYSQSGANHNFQTIPGTQVLNRNRSQANSKSPQGMKMQMVNNITKTTAITNSKQSIGSKVGVDDISVNVGLPKINNKKKHLASIDDDYEEEYDDRIPQKPQGIHRNTSDEDLNQSHSSQQQIKIAKQRSREVIDSSNTLGKSSSVGADSRGVVATQQRKHPVKQGSLLPQVSNRSRKSLEDVGGAEAYSNGDGRESRAALKVSGLNQSPSLISLHDQGKGNRSREQIQIQKKRSSKDSSLIRNGRSGSDDQYQDEVNSVTGQYNGPVGLQKSNKKALGAVDQNHPQVNKRARPQGVSQSALDHHGAPPAVANSRLLNHSPSQHYIQGDGRSQYQNSHVNSKKKIMLNNGVNSQQQIQTGANSGLIQIQGHSGQNYKRIVNIYSVNNYKNKRKSHAPESRVALNHSMLPNHNVQGKVGPYEDRRHHDFQLPEISGQNKNHSYNEGSSVGRPYAYKSTIDQQNSAMIAKLMSRKKSYERIMKMEEGGSSGGRHSNLLHPELSQKKNAEVLLTANRGGGVSRAQNGSSTRKQLQYYDSTPTQQPRKHASVMKKQLINNSAHQANLLDVTGQNVQKQHGKSSAYLANSGSLAELQ